MFLVMFLTLFFRNLCFLIFLLFWSFLIGVLVNILEFYNLIQVSISRDCSERWSIQVWHRSIHSTTLPIFSRLKSVVGNYSLRSKGFKIRRVVIVALLGDWISEGEENQEIAENLGISINASGCMFFLRLFILDVPGIRAAVSYSSTPKSYLFTVFETHELYLQLLHFSEKLVITIWPHITGL